MEQTLYWAILFFGGVQVLYWVLLFSRLIFHKSHTPAPSKPSSSSIVLCFKNEAKNLRSNLPYLLSQGRPIVAVDDFSTDQSVEEVLNLKNDAISLIKPEEDRLGKKAAALAGAKYTKTEHCLFTDADCIPNSDQWANLMEPPIDKQVVLGYAPLIPTRQFVSKFARYENYLTAIQYLSYAVAGVPYMGVGRNMLVNRQLYLDTQPKVKGRQLASGDDDLVINQLANGTNTAIQLNMKSFVYSAAPANFKEFFRQKTRHVSASVYYKWYHKVLLGLFAFSHLAFFGFLFASFFLGLLTFEMALSILVIKWFFQQLVNFPIMKRLHQKDLFLMFFVLDIFLWFYYLVVGVKAVFGKGKGW